METLPTCQRNQVGGSQMRSLASNLTIVISLFLSMLFVIESQGLCKTLLLVVTLTLDLENQIIIYYSD